MISITRNRMKCVACALLASAALLGMTSSVQAVLVGHWTFDDNTANDSSGMGHDGTLVGAGAAIVSDPIRGLVYSGDGSDSKVDLEDTSGNNPAGLNIIGEFTAAAWIRPRDVPRSGVGGILQRGHTGSSTAGTAREFTLRLNGGDYEFTTWSPTIGPDVNAPVEDSNWWVHLAGTMTDAGDGTFTYRLFRNGELLDTVDGGPGLFNDFPSDVGWAIGARGGVSGTEREFDGFIDDVRMYDNPLSQAEIQALMGPIPLRGDTDNNGQVDLNDYIAIRDNLHSTGATLAQGDVNFDGVVNLLDFRIWKSNRTDLGAGAGAQTALGSVPEPSSSVLAMLALWGWLSCGGSRRGR